MDAFGVLCKDRGVREENAQPKNIEVCVLRSKLINLTLDWELQALALDSQRYRAAGIVERQHLRDNALAYRKCIAKVTEVINDSVLACRTQQ
jgi:hypothetical protein